MRAPLLPLLAALLLPSAAFAQGGEAVPFLGWEGGPARAAGPSEDASFEGAATLGRGVLGLSAGVGFPFLSVEAGAGISDAMDLRLAFRTIYGASSQVDATTRLRLHGDRAGLAVAARFGAEWSFFQPDDTGLLLTGNRDLTLSPGAVVSWAMAPGALFFGDLGVQLALDFDPASRPLGGPPPELEAFVNLPLRVGVEMPLSGGLRFSAGFGLDARLGARQSGEPALLPRVAVALIVLG